MSLPLPLGCSEGSKEIEEPGIDNSPQIALVGESHPPHDPGDRSNPREVNLDSDYDSDSSACIAPTYLDSWEAQGKKSGKRHRRVPPSTSPAPIWVRAGEYRLAPCWREWALRGLGLPPQQIAIDLFSRKGFGACASAIDRSQNAFAFDWSKLGQGVGDKYLWANPPFGVMHRVLAKIALEECKVVVVVPQWEEASWWPMFLGMVSHFTMGAPPPGHVIFLWFHQA